MVMIRTMVKTRTMAMIRTMVIKCYLKLAMSPCLLFMRCVLTEMERIIQGVSLKYNPGFSADSKAVV